jgi:hypothetical protein
MTPKYETIYLTLIRPRDGDAGTVEPIHFRTEDDFVVLVGSNGATRRNRKGQPLKRQFGPGENARKIASIMGREHMPSRRSGFGRKIIYPPLNY